MRNAETILGVIHERGTRGLPLERVYRLLFSRELYLLAYDRLYRNDGALTRGATADTVDGMSWRRSTASLTKYVMSGIDGRQFGESRFPSPTGRHAHWASQRGRTSWFRRSSG